MYRKRHGMTTRLKESMTKEEYYKHKKEYDRKWGIKKRVERMELKKTILSDKCVICSHPDRLRAHRKDGKQHKPFESMRLDEYIKELKSGEYVVLCYKCHGHVHWCMKYLKMKWLDMIGVLK